jgi:manganese-dependent inorganic pyrophosphatase
MRIFIVGHKSPDLDSIASAFEYTEFLKKSKRYEGAEIIPARAGEPNPETIYIFEKFGVEMPKHIEEFTIEETDGVILVDHNEESQRHASIPSEQIIEIVDHHKINVSFIAPVHIDVKPVGATGTVVYELFDMYGHAPSEKTLGLILASILSDTQGLKSSTTSGMDSAVAHKLAEKLKLDLEEFTFEIYKAKSDITGLTPEEIAKKDFKVFDLAGKKVFINQLETVEPEKVLALKDELIKATVLARSQEGASLGFQVVTDILKINSQIIYTNEEEQELVEKAFTTEGKDNIADIGPRMSRKKDITPAMEKTLSQ